MDEAHTKRRCTPHSKTLAPSRPKQTPRRSVSLVPSLMLRSVAGATQRTVLPDKTGGFLNETRPVVLNFNSGQAYG